jgi:lipoate-protein ligase A
MVERVAGDPARLHHWEWPARRTIRWCFADRQAIVLGRAQPAEHVDVDGARQLGVDVVRRTSGGGAVLVGPGHGLWVDVVIPRGDPLWDEDVGRAMWWLGDAWARALAELGVDGVEVHRGAMVRTVWSARACVAGVGPGEVSWHGRKVVGIAQRRARRGAIFQCAVPERWTSDLLVALIGGNGAPEPTLLAGAAVGWRDLIPTLDPRQVQAALFAALP